MPFPPGARVLTPTVDVGDAATVLGQYHTYLASPDAYPAAPRPSCRTLGIVDLLEAHPSYRLDPKFHLFQLETISSAPPGMTQYRLGDLLTAEEEQLDPSEYPDQEFITLTLRQDGTLDAREAGVGHNPPSWHGAYFKPGSRWFRAQAGDVIVSQIDLWKGCVAVIPQEYNGAIVTGEFPLHRVDTARLDPRYLAVLLRSSYLRRAIRAITTGHSNRRRTQPEDFDNLRVFLPDLPTQRAIACLVDERRTAVADARGSLSTLMAQLDDVILGTADPATLLSAPADDMPVRGDASSRSEQL